LLREDIRGQLDNIGAIANLSTPEEFRKLLESEVARWRAAAKDAGLEPN
jgi:tripartite-type tricarboxylate transporter receptor subunit TctC